jgi:hypothetical protein
MEVTFIPQPQNSARTYNIVSLSTNKKLGVIQKFQTKWIGWDNETGAFRGPFGLSGSPFNTLNQAKAFARDYYGGK